MNNPDPDTTHHSWSEQLLDGTPVLIRPIRKEDTELKKAFIEELSMESRYYRFLEAVRHPNPDLIRRLTDIDQTRDAAFVALLGNSDKSRIIGVSRYFMNSDDESAECSVVVSDKFQHKGLGTLLMRHLIELARSRGIMRLISYDSADNPSMGNFARHLGFRCETDRQDSTLVQHHLKLRYRARPGVRAGI